MVSGEAVRRELEALAQLLGFGLCLAAAVRYIMMTSWMHRRMAHRP